MPSRGYEDIGGMNFSGSPRRKTQNLGIECDKDMMRTFEEKACQCLSTELCHHDSEADGDDASTMPRYNQYLIRDRDPLLNDQYMIKDHVEALIFNEDDVLFRDNHYDTSLIGQCVYNAMVEDDFPLLSAQKMPTRKRSYSQMRPEAFDIAGGDAKRLRMLEPRRNPLIDHSDYCLGTGRRDNTSPALSPSSSPTHHRQFDHVVINSHDDFMEEELKGLSAVPINNVLDMGLMSEPCPSNAVPRPISPVPSNCSSLNNDAVWDSCYGPDSAAAAAPPPPADQQPSRSAAATCKKPPSHSRSRKPASSHRKSASPPVTQKPPVSSSPPPAVHQHTISGHRIGVTVVASKAKCSRGGQRGQKKVGEMSQEDLRKKLEKNRIKALKEKQRRDESKRLLEAVKSYLRTTRPSDLGEKASQQKTMNVLQDALECMSERLCVNTKFLKRARMCLRV